jgi:hypothetical protein
MYPDPTGACNDEVSNLPARSGAEINCGIPDLIMIQVAQLAQCPATATFEVWGAAEETPIMWELTRAPSGIRSKSWGGAVRYEGDQHSVLLSPEGLECWLREYHVDLPLSISGDSPTANEESRGIGWVLHVGPPGRELRPEELDQDNPLHRVIAAEHRRRTRE